MKKLILFLVFLVAFGATTFAQENKFFYSKKIDRWIVLGYRGDPVLPPACVISSGANAESDWRAELVFELNTAEVTLRVIYKKWNITNVPGAVYGLKNDKEKARLTLFLASAGQKTVLLPFAFLPERTALLGGIEIDKIMEAPAISKLEVSLPFASERVSIPLKDSKKLLDGLINCIKTSNSSKPKKKILELEASRNRLVVDVKQ